ncbi:hypothetical protein [Komagataeibacter europaeus]|uniref:hypothetical protein n=1 Tax=Komagataeibacter europaeus TaxID=33995 RepID=UPI0003006602|nr:hypothetical protein [Komagataeibacter europaeus]GBQ49598.1 hypothetical protein AA18890_3204 [Komagataeibacter europaeus LMG 18890]
MAECDDWNRVVANEPRNTEAFMQANWRSLEIQKRRGIRPYVEQARQNWLQRRRVVPLRSEKVKERELIA